MDLLVVNFIPTSSAQAYLAGAIRCNLTALAGLRHLSLSLVLNIVEGIYTTDALIIAERGKEASLRVKLAFEV